MATDLETRPDEDQDAIQRHYNDTFNDLTSAEHMAKDGTPGDIGGDEGGFFRNETTPKTGDETPGKPEAKKDTASDSSPESGLFSGNEGGPSKGRRVLGFNITRRRTITASIISLVIGGGGLFMGSLATGPLELIHLSEIFSHNLSKVESDSSSRTGNMMRYARAWQNKDFRYTRVGFIGARIVNGVLNDYEKSGFKLTDATLTGRPNSIELDREKINKNFHETKNMSPKELDKWASDTLGVEFKNGKADMSGLSDRGIKKVAKSANRKLLGDGRIKSGIRARELGKFYGLNNLFHPFSAALDGKIAKAVAAAKAKKAEDNNPADEDPKQAAESTLQTEQADARAPIEEKARTKLSEFKSEHSGLSDGIVKWGGQAAGILWATGCTLRDAGDTITVINRDAVVVPSMIQATQLMAAGAQIKAGTVGQPGDLTEEQIGALADTLTDKNGNDIWSATPMEALTSSSNLSTKNDIPDDQKAAFADKGMGGTLSNIGNKILTYIGLKSTADGIGALTNWIPGVKHLGLSNPCSLTYAGITVAVGLAGYAADVGSCLVGCEGFALSAAVDALVTGVVRETESFALSSLAIGKITDMLVHSGTLPTLAADAFSGPAGGDLLAYGAREAGNMTAIASGGLEIANSAKTTIVGTAGQEEQQQFKSQSMFAKVFDTSDYRSVTGQIADTLNRGLSHNTNSIVSTIVNPFHSLGAVFGSVLNPKALAGTPTSSWTGNYDWGMPQYGIPDSMLNDSRMADPFQNAEDVGQYLTAHCGSDTGAASEGECGGDNGWTNRIKICFGNDLTYTQDSTTNTMVWDVAPAANTDVDPNATGPGTYGDANCSGDLSGEWGKIVMFINDANNIKSMDCLEGDNDTSAQSCSDLGVNGGAANACTGTATPGTAPSTTSSSGLPSWSVMPDVSSQPVGSAVNGKVSVAIANIRSADTFAHNLGIIDGNNPDFMGLQEVSNESLQHMEQSAPGYGAYRDNTPDPDSAPGTANQSTSDAIMWRKDTWTFLTGGRVKVTNHDHVVFEGNNRDWNRYVVWGMFKRKSDGVIVSFASTHMMTAPDGQRQWGTLDPPMTRTQQYELSMQNVKQLIGVLSQHGPVLFGGDMNDTLGDTNSWAPVPQMKAIGYTGSSDKRVLLSFNPPGTSIVNNRIVRLDLHGDHNDGSIQTTFDMSGVGPGAFNGSVAASSSNCATSGGGTNLKIATFNVRGATHPEKGSVDYRAQGGAKFINDSGFQIVGLQELETAKGQRDDYVKYLGSNWDIWPAKNAPNEHHDVENSIAWDTSSYSKVDSGLYGPDAAHGNKDYHYFSNQPLYVPWVELQDNSTGQKFIVENTHDPADVGGNWVSIRTANARQHLKDAQEWAKQGLPVFITGDFNSTFYSRGGTSDPPARADLPYCVMTKTGELLNVFDIVRKIGAPVGVNCPASHADVGSLPGQYGNLIDNIYVTPQIQVSSQQWSNAPKDAKPYRYTDHAVMWITATIPGSTTADSSDQTNTPTLSSVKNFRDASGTNNALKSGVLYRSAQLNQLSDADSAALSNVLGSKGTIIDLRSSYQRKKAPDVSVVGSKNTSVPIDGILDQKLMVTDATRRSQLGKALKLAANAPGPVLIHCVDGKDRTGWAVAMIMYVSGASDSEVMNEYMASQAAFPGGVREVWLNDGLAAAKSKYGSSKDTNAQAVIKYLKKGAGLSDSDIQKIRNKFEEPPSDTANYQ
ncbi:MAG TPA: tyrosine-protein phosphatase [Candidatus Microsaccharimonas sp.]|nr:tyrosine-protein phosphatase [Candidatus Microsaccharimonas sp.]